MIDFVRARRGSRRLSPAIVTDRDYFPFAGGLNVVDQPLAIRPGFAIAARNYEPAIRGGYERLRGYERYDGRTAPSAASYHILAYDRASAVAANAATITGATSTATGYVLGSVVTQAVTHVNSALYSADITQGAWTKTNLTPGAVGMSNPLGPTAFQLVDTGTNARHEFGQSITKAGVTENWRASFWIKANDISRIRLTMDDASSNSTFVEFDLTAGGITILGNTGSGVTLVTQEIGGYPDFPGWLRVGITASINSSITTVRARLSFLNALSAVSYAGIGQSLYFSGSMIERAPAAAAGVYVDTQGELRGNGTGYYILGRVAGTFVDNEDLDVSAVTQSAANGGATLNGATTDALNAQYLALAREDARAQIAVVPGSGRILGTAIYMGVVYAFRNNVGGTAAVMHKATAGGWVPITLSKKLHFDAGQAAGIAEGDAVTGATSGATGTVRRVVIQSGQFSDNTAAGYLIVSGGSGVFSDNEAVQVGGTTRVTANGASAVQVLAPNGRYEFRVHNFGGHTATQRLYGADGQNFAFEYQSGASEFFLQIETGMTVDKPAHIAIHKERLYLSFSGGSVQRSGQSDAASWTVVTGAAEFAIGEEITGFLEEVGDVLFVFGRNRTKYLAGDPPAEVLRNFTFETGALEGTMQRVGQGYYLDDRGITSLAATQNFGNFASNSISALIQPLLAQLALHATTSCVVKDLSRYRLFFDDGQFLSMGINGKKVVGMLFCDYGRPVRTIFAGEAATGGEMIVFGSDDGYVYQAERGTSFDGQPIAYFLRLAFHYSGSPSRNKKYRWAQFDIACKGPISIQIAADYSFADPNISAEVVKSLTLPGGGAFWNLFNWNQANWGTPLVAPAIIDLEGEGLNVSFLFAGSSAEEESHQLNGVAMHWSMRRMNRGTSYA